MYGLYRTATAPTAGVLVWGLPSQLKVDGRAATEMTATAWNLGTRFVTLRASPLGCGNAAQEVAIPPMGLAQMPVAVYGDRLPTGRSRLPVGISGRCGSRPIEYRTAIEGVVERKL